MNPFSIFGTVVFLILFNLNNNHAALNSSVITSNNISPNAASLPDEIRCITSLCPHNITYTWTINGFSVYETMNDYSFKSPGFFAPTNNDCEWEMRFCSSNTTIKFSVLLTNNSKVNEIVGKFRISILNHSGEVLWSKRISNHKFVGGNDGNGWRVSIDNVAFFRTHLIQNDTLIISCKLSYIIPCTNTNTVSCQQFQSNNTTTTTEFNTIGSDLIENLESLFENPSFADLLIEVNGKNYWAHKSILAARSVIFASLIRETKTTDYFGRTFLNITDIDEKVTGEILRYIYTGKCKNLSKLSKGLLVAANKYALAPLGKICAEEIGKSLTVENAADLLTFADTHGPDELKARVIQFIVNESAQVLNSAAWKNMVSLNSKLVNEVCQALAHSVNGNLQNKNNVKEMCYI